MSAAHQAWRTPNARRNSGRVIGSFLMVPDSALRDSPDPATPASRSDPSRAPDDPAMR